MGEGGLDLRRVLRVSAPILALLTYGWLSLLAVLVMLDYLLGTLMSGGAGIAGSALRISAASAMLAAWLYSWWMLALYLRRRLQGSMKSLAAGEARG